MRQDASRNGSARCCLRIRCDGGSSAFAVLVGGVSCSAAGRCRLRSAWHWLSRHPECARLLRACVARETQKEADASWREHLFFLAARLSRRGTSFTESPSPPSHGGGTRRASGQLTCGKW